MRRLTAHAARRCFRPVRTVSQRPKGPQKHLFTQKSLKNHSDSFNNLGPRRPVPDNNLFGSLKLKYVLGSNKSTLILKYPVAQMGLPSPTPQIGGIREVQPSFQLQIAHPGSGCTSDPLIRHVPRGGARHPSRGRRQAARHTGQLRAPHLQSYGFPMKIASAAAVTQFNNLIKHFNDFLGLMTVSRMEVEARQRIKNLNSLIPTVLHGKTGF